MKLYPSEKEFIRLAKQGNVIPVYGELFADLETPVSAFQKLDDGNYSYLLESMEGPEKVARYSFLGSAPRYLIRSHGSEVVLAQVSAGKLKVIQHVAQSKDPLIEVERFMRQFRFVPSPDLPRFCGGLVGYLGYNNVQFYEPVPAHREDDLSIPDTLLMLADTMVIFDHARHRLLLVANGLTQGRSATQVYRAVARQIRRMAAQLHAPLPRARTRKALTRKPIQPASVRSTLTQAEFARNVRRAKAYIRAGDIIQVVLSQRLERDIRCTAFDVYRSLRFLNPSPYMFFLRFGKLALVGASPEMLVRCENGVLETRPIAGTRPRGKTDQEDERMIQQLKASPKERAEHIMLVDLGRNDLGRVGRVGSVAIPELMVVEKYSHVLHLVSSVTARLKPSKSAYDAFRATFPAGTVSGAPKVRAMEIIAELEPKQRGHYAGAVGYFDFSGNIDTCIAIRTILIQGKHASVQAGAGIVADSQPAREYQETLNKARGMLKALDMAEQHEAFHS